MKTIIKGKNIEVPDRVRDYAERKLQRLGYLDDRSEATLELFTEQHRSTEASHIVEVTLVVDGQTLRSRGAGATYEAGIDDVLDKIERRAVDHREKPRLRGIPTGEKGRVPGSEIAEEGAPREPRVVKTKRFGITPMFEEDAIAEMNDLGHAFFIFVNAEDERLNILYRRKDGDYGIIDPVVDGAYSGRSNGR